MALNEKGKIEATISANADKFVAELDKAQQAAKETASTVKNESQKASSSFAAVAQNLKDTVTTAAGQIELIKKGFQAAVEIAKHFAMEAVEALKMTSDLAMESADSLQEASDAFKETKSTVDGYYERLVELNDADKLSNVQKEEQAMLLAKLKDRYELLGVAIDDVSGKVTGLDEAFAAKLDHDQAVQINMLDNQISALKEAYDAQTAIVAKSTGWRSYVPGLASVANSDAEAASREQSSIGLRIRQLTRQRNELASQTPGEDYRRRAEAKRKDEEEKARQEEAAAEKRVDDMLVKAEEEAAKKRIEAEKSVADSAKRYMEARKGWAKTMHDEQVRRAKAATDAEIAQLQRRRNALQSKLGRFGFSLSMDPNETGAERRRRVQRQNLDASIAEKQARQAEGHRVHYTSKEEARIKEYQQTASRIKKTDAEIAQLEAASKSRDAAETQRAAAERIQEAADRQKEAATSLQTAVQTVQSLNYTSKFDALIRAVSSIGQNAYIVK